MNAKTRIMTYLNDYLGQSYSNRELAEVLSLPSASVRRTINELKEAEQVRLDATNSTHRIARWMSAAA